MAVWVIVMLVVVVALIEIFFSFVAYHFGKGSGDTATSAALIIFGLLVGVTLLPGIAHLIGVMQYNQKLLKAAVKQSEAS